MKIQYTKKSKKTLERIDSIRAELASYRESIELLNGYADGRLTLRGGDYCDRAAFSKRTAEDDERYLWTMKNIKTQILLYERELDTLLRYGA